MKKLICLILAMLMMLSLAACANEGDETRPGSDATKETDVKETEGKDEESGPREYDLKAAYEAIDAEIGFEENILEVVYMAEDVDEIGLWQYGVDPEGAAAFEYIKDYAITVPTDYCYTFAAFVFDRELTEDEIAGVKAKVKMDYLELQTSALQMYMPDEYAKMAWACENEDLIWREYGNALVMIITGDKEAVDAFEIFENVCVK